MNDEIDRKNSKKRKIINKKNKNNVKSRKIILKKVKFFQKYAELSVL